MAGYVSSLSGLVGLTYLSLESTAVTGDVSLSGLVGLTDLRLYHTAGDVSSLSRQLQKSSVQRRT
eukprot:SAG11_NODE_1229_length_5462_cov_12.053888_3_plen_65_part_00